MSINTPNTVGPGIGGLENFLRDWWRRRWTMRRGRGYDLISIDSAEGENNYSQVSAIQATLESLYERQWAKSVIDHTLEQLRIELRANGKEVLFEHFNSILATTPQTFSYLETAESLKLTAGACAHPFIAGDNVSKP